MRRLIWGALALLASMTFAQGQNVYFAPDGSQVPGAVQFCLNASNQAIACPSPTGPVQLPTGSTALLGVGTGTVGAVTGTLTSATAQTAYLCSLDISAIGGTATIGPITVTGLLGGTYTWQFASSASGATLSRTFNPCLPASGTNTNIVATTTADATATAVDVNLSGFRVASTTATYPTNSTPITAVASGSTGIVSASLAGAAAKTTYICSVDVSALGGTATIGPVTITGLAGGTWTLQLAATATGNTFGRTFSPCLPASATNTAIVTATTADGTATAVNVNTSGFQL